MSSSGVGAYTDTDSEPPLKRAAGDGHGHEIVFSRADLPFGELSNFFMVPVRFCGVVYPSSEHAYQAQKLLGPGASEASREGAELVRQQNTPYKATLLANLNPPTRYQWQQRLREITDDLFERGARVRDDWDGLKVNIMLGVLRSKFRWDDACRTALLGTGTRPLVELSATDTFWARTAAGVGSNKLGSLLERVRGELVADPVSALAMSLVALPAPPPSPGNRDSTDDEADASSTEIYSTDAEACASP